jgi:hypothetical protein
MTECGNILLCRSIVEPQLASQTISPLGEECWNELSAASAVTTPQAVDGSPRGDQAIQLFVDGGSVRAGAVGTRYLVGGGTDGDVVLANDQSRTNVEGMKPGDQLLLFNADSAAKSGIAFYRVGGPV